MRILIVRHGDPDYSIDSLTEKGWREAELLAKRLTKLDIKAAYISPLGRAKDTARMTLEQLGLEAKECFWLKEFDPQIEKPTKVKSNCIWDWLPLDWTGVEEYYDRKTWTDTDIMKKGNVKERYLWVIENLDNLLAEHGYVREHNYYKVEHANMDTIVLFCHFGIECVLLGHLLGISPMNLWHGVCAAPSSVTTLVTEERRKGTAYFRMTGFGDISHLYAGDEEPSRAARFCECFENEDERHD